MRVLIRLTAPLEQICESFRVNLSQLRSQF